MPVRQVEYARSTSSPAVSMYHHQVRSSSTSLGCISSERKLVESTRSTSSDTHNDYLFMYRWANLFSLPDGRLQLRMDRPIPEEGGGPPACSLPPSLRQSKNVLQLIPLFVFVLKFNGPPSIFYLRKGLQFHEMTMLLLLWMRPIFPWVV